MTQLTQKELMLLQDNINMCKETAQFLQGCVNMVTDPELKNICQDMLQDHQQDVRLLMEHITQTNLQ